MDTSEVVHLPPRSLKCLVKSAGLCPALRLVSQWPLLPRMRTLPPLRPSLGASTAFLRQPASLCMWAAQRRPWPRVCADIAATTVVSCAASTPMSPPSTSWSTLAQPLISWRKVSSTTCSSSASERHTGSSACLVATAIRQAGLSARHKRSLMLSSCRAGRVGVLCAAARLDLTARLVSA
jgi:hypothetical protein